MTSVALAQGRPAAEVDPLDEPASLLNGGGGPAVDAAVLMYFGKFEDQLGVAALLRDMVQRLRESGDPRAAPALAAVLNREGVYDRRTPYMNEGRIQSDQSRIVRNVLVVPATEAWFDLLWPHMTEQERVDALLDTIRPEPTVHLLFTEEVMKRVKDVEQPLRAAFYDRLLDPEIKYDWRSGWMGNVLSAMGRLMRAFPPTDEQREAILASSRTLPRLLYLNLHGSPDEEWAVNLFTELLNKNADRHVVLGAVLSYASRVTGEREATKSRYRHILLQQGYDLIDDFRADRIDAWSLGRLFGIADTLFKYGEDEDTLTFLIALREFFSTYDPEQRPLSDLLKRALPWNIEGYLQNVDFRIDMWTENKQAADQ